MEQVSLVIPMAVSASPSLSVLQAVASNGTVHWLLEGPLSLQIKGILSIYLFDKIGTSNTSTTKQICRFINLPDGFRQGCRASVENLCLGVVKEQMRLSQLLREKKAGLVLRVWELKYSDNKNEEAAEEEVSWFLVHEGCLKMTAVNRKMFGLSFHRNNGNVVFVLCNYNRNNTKRAS